MLPDTVPFVTSVTDPTRWEKASLRGSTTDFTGPKEFHLIHQDGFFSVKAPLVEAPASFTPAVDTANFTRSTMGREPIFTHKESLDKLDQLIYAKDSLVTAIGLFEESYLHADPGIPISIICNRRAEDEPDLNNLSIQTYYGCREVRDALAGHELPASLQDEVNQMLALSGTACQDDEFIKAETIFQAARHGYHLVARVLTLVDLAEWLRFDIASGEVAEADIPMLVGDILEDLDRLMSEAY